MLVQLAGGESETVRRLREAGFVTTTSIAEGDPDLIQKAGGISGAAARRLVKTARERLASPVAIREGQDLDQVLPPLPPKARGKAAPSAGAPRGDAGPRRRKGRAAVRGDGAGAKTTLQGIEGEAMADAEGVSSAESLDLTGEPPAEAWTQQSFWRFG
ncbi:MAG: helix-hairpin-helix domain-containing protein [Acidobacteriota bacterium]